MGLTKEEEKILLDTGFDLRDTVIVVDEARPCTVCGKTTSIMDYCFERPLCSPECVSKWTDVLFPEGS